jgi:glycine cleavage system H protein
MNIPADLRYTASHEWVRREADGTLSVGITDHAQDSLGELVFIELPDKGRALSAGESCAVVESVKAASDVYAPVAGEVVARNDALAEAPGELNKDPYAAWLFRIKPAAGGGLEQLMDAQAYRKSFAQA